MITIEEIFAYFKKNLTKWDVLIILGIFTSYFVTRLVNLDQWPIFSDEGIYIRWAKVAWHDASWRFISLTDGRQPLQTWGTIPFLKLFSDQALVAGRLFSVSTGLVALCGMYSLNWYLWGKRGGYIAAVLQVFMPYFLFYDRMALVDSAVNAGFIWMILWSIVLARTRRLDVALLYGLTAGIALLAKSSSRIFIMIAAGGPVLFWTKKWSKSILPTLNYYFLFGIVAFMAIILYNIQRLSPFMHFVELKNTTFVMTFAEFLANPLANFWGNSKIIPLYITWESGWVIVPVSIAGMYLLARRDSRLFLYILAYFILPFFAIAFFAKVIFPRYLIFYGSLFIISATFLISSLPKKPQILLLSFILGSMLILDFPIIFNPIKTSFPPVDRGQYIEGITAVWGAGDLMDLMSTKSKVKPVKIISEGNFGLVADVLDVYLKQGDQIEIKGEWPLEEKHLIENQDILNTKYVFIVFSHRTEFPQSWPMKLVREYKKPAGGGQSLYLFELTPQETASINIESK